MNEERSLLERAASQIAPPQGVVEGLHLRRHRKRRNQRIGAAVVALAVALVAIGGLLNAIRSDHSPTPVATPSGVFGRIGRWITYGAQNPLDPRHPILMAVDPANPATPVSLGPVGGNPIAWSRDGQHLLLSDWSVLNADGSTTVLGTPGGSQGSAGGSFGSFSPDGTEVVYGYGRGLYVVGTDGGSLRLLVSRAGGGNFLYDPSWSPDGSHIVYLGHTNSTRTWVVSEAGADGSGGHVLVNLSASTRVTEPGGLTWSPDGSHLALFIDPSKYQAQIWVMRADGSGLHRVTTKPDSVWPQWSPDGSQIAFVRSRVLFTMNADGSDPRPVGGAPKWKVGAVAPAWTIAWNPSG